jgi:Putative MetA-pathway of phenol degradation
LFPGVRSVNGIGDITLRVKGIAWKGERAGLGLGVDIRLPTGDSLNFLGAGAAGFKPFVVWSYRSRISPHAVVGYEVNGSSRIAGDLTTGTKERLPSQLTYAAGADVWLTNWFTAAFDLVGQQVFEAKRTSVTSLQEPSACKDSACLFPNFDPPKSDQSLSPATRTFNVTNASVGVKVRPFSNLLITANALIKLNNGGLRANVVPLVGVSYTF